MALNKTVKVDKVEVVGIYKAIQVRTATTIDEDGEIISKTFHRHVLHPGRLNESGTLLIDTDLSGEDPEVQAIASAVWTQEVKDAWEDKLIEDRNL